MDLAQREQLCFARSEAASFQAGWVALAVSGAGVLAGNAFSPAFRARLGTSGKTALVATSSLGAFIMAAEPAMARCMREVVVVGKRTLERERAVDAGLRG
jgi:hypothetical protein